jgi:hypothetical protein
VEPTLELICHHTYAGFGGIPVDRSGHDSHGLLEGNPQFDSDGIAPRSGTLAFTQNGNRVRIPVPAGSVWGKLGGIKVEAIVRWEVSHAVPQTIVAGDAAFSFFLNVHGVLHAAFHGAPTVSGAPTDEVLTKPPFTLSGGNYWVDAARWVRLGFVHDGLSTMELSVDGHVVARRQDLLSAVPGVGPMGVGIGNDPQHDDYFLDGAIDEIKVWRIIPQTTDREFFNRPVDQSAAECWDRFLRSLAASLDRHPDCAQLIQRAAGDAIDRFRRAILAMGPAAWDRFTRTAQKYAALWRAGKLDSPEMANLFADWCAWLAGSGIALQDDPAVQQLVNSGCLDMIRADCVPLDCDPQLAAYFELIMRGCR